MSVKRTYRCAVYTRKSTEEGLDKEFNSLDAQRDACASYIRSQVAEGWKVLPQHYDDGGFTGANVDRPALQRLLSDIDRGLVDVVVVYKIDRLTRSLADFAKIVERFDARNVSFVSITQSFNTTTSMGRLTLNVLLSFAQFEREVTAERIRDKIAASRAKGMWMGGGIPLGYDVRDRRLVINEAEARTVRMAFKRYLELGSIGELRAELESKGVKTKARVSKRGNKIGGGTWYVGPLRHLLRNPVYVGLAAHKGQHHQGLHKPIVAKPLFDRVQEMLSRGARTWQRKRTIEASGLLTGLIFDDKGNRMSPQWSVGQNKTKHGYYVSQALLQRRRAAAGSLLRVSAPVIEELVLRCVRAVQSAGHPPSREAAGQTNLSSGGIHEFGTAVRGIVMKVVVSCGDVRLDCAQLPARADSSKDADRLKQIEAQLPVGAKLVRTDHGVQIMLCGRPQRRGGAKRIEGWSKQDWSVVTPRHDTTLLSALGRAHGWREAIERGDGGGIEVLAAREKLNRRQVSRLLRLAFLAPDIQKAIVEGRQPAGFNLKRFSESVLPIAWDQQRRQMGMSD